MFAYLRRHKYLLAYCAVVVMVVATSMYLINNPVNKAASSDLLSNDWSHMEGVRQNNDGLTVSYVGRKIVNQDGSGGYPNPAVGFNAPYLITDGSFGVNLQLKNAASRAEIQMYAELPNIYDEWRYEGKSMSLKFEKDAVLVRMWDGSSQTPIETINKALALNDNVSVRVENNWSESLIYINDESPITVRNHKIFNTKRVWFGFSNNAPGTSWAIASLTKCGNSVVVTTSQQKALAKQQESLKNLAKQMKPSLLIGTAVATSQLYTDLKYSSIAFNEFSSFTPENDFKPQFLHPSKNSYSFNDADSLVAIARKNNVQIHGHTLVFGEANPSWMQITASAERKAVMIDYINTVVSHFKGKVASWDVVNEPLSEADSDYENSDGLRKHLWYKAIGPSYISTALIDAHSADPGAQLYINDFGLENDGVRWDTMLALVTKLKKQGVPLDGVGFQAHVYESADEIDTVALTNHMQQLADLGLKARISEIDVYGDDEQNQADEYAKVLSICLSAPNCVAYSTWGFTDRYGSTTEPNTYPLEHGDDLVWNHNFEPKKALEALLEQLKEY